MRLPAITTALPKIHFILHCIMKHTVVFLTLLYYVNIAVGSENGDIKLRNYPNRRPAEDINWELEYDYHEAPLKRFPSAKPVWRRPVAPITGPPPFLGKPILQKPVAEEELRVESKPLADLKNDTRLCPEANGFFPDVRSCDVYYECVDFEAYEKVCPDGLVFVNSGKNEEKCEFLYAHDCSSRPGLQRAKPTPNCERRYGFFKHMTDCGKYYHCLNGQATLQQCPPGLIFSFKIAICIYPNREQKTRCNLETEPLSSSEWESKESASSTNSTQSPFELEEPEVTETGSLEMD